MEREELIRAIGEPMRLRILELLTRRQYCVRSLARMLGISEPAVSQHLRVMREAGLVTVEKLGYHSHYRLVPEALEQLGEQFMQLAEAARKARGARLSWAWPGGAPSPRGVRLSRA